ncbi:MAG: GIY-YIG nuclease family protein [Chloroflexi bacterium]|nr:GIY-YIG nuclease family protein [Chloroflexota bacterium]
MSAAGGTYALLLTLEKDYLVEVGRLGSLHFQPGHYIYVGRARRRLFSRIKAHLHLHQRPHWHIDYLRQRAGVTGLWWALTPEPQECLWSQAVLSLPGALVPRPRFGASDCRCLTHLVYFNTAPSPSLFRRHLAKLGGQVPVHVWAEKELAEQMEYTRECRGR